MHYRPVLVATFALVFCNENCPDNSNTNNETENQRIQGKKTSSWNLNLARK